MEIFNKNHARVPRETTNIKDGLIYNFQESIKSKHIDGVDRLIKEAGKHWK